MTTIKKEQRIRRSRQTRSRIALQRVARLTVHRTNLHIYAQVISEDGSRVLASASTVEEIIDEISIARLTERGATRGDDRFSEAAMEDRKKEGYF